MITDSRLLELARSVADVPGIRAVVLGGSRATGRHHEGSDVDLGLYYDAATLDVPALREVARTDVAGPGGWGPWVDGGSWMSVDDTAVDLILRDVRRVLEQRDRAIAGQFAFHQQMGHPLGFLDIAYAGEAATCVPRVDPGGLVEELRRGLDPYPPALRTAFLDELWGAEFLAAGAVKGSARPDVGYVQMCCASALMRCAHAWHAAAGSWVTNEKGLIPSVASLDVHGKGMDAAEFADQASTALAAIGTDPSPAGLAAAARTVPSLVAATRRALSAAAGAP